MGLNTLERAKRLVIVSHVSRADEAYMMQGLGKVNCQEPGKSKKYEKVLHLYSKATNVLWP